MTAASIVRLKITLDDVEPKVLRRIEAPLSIRLDRLHLTIQAAMGWTNSHLYRNPRPRCRMGNAVDPDWGDGPLDAHKAKLVDVLEDVGIKTLRYLYDFGDGWEHTIKIERLDDPIPGVLYPRLTEAKGRCPPEDVGGPWGYAEFLDALKDPEHERHAEMFELLGVEFDPSAIDAEPLKANVAALAKRWSRKPAAKKPRPA